MQYVFKVVRTVRQRTTSHSHDTFAENKTAGATQTQMQTVHVGFVAIGHPRSTAAPRRVGGGPGGPGPSGGAHGERVRHSGRERPRVATAAVEADRHHRQEGESVNHPLLMCRSDIIWQKNVLSHS